jgi:3-phosphoshikimate 1-carboxyvinyltransferase
LTSSRIIHPVRSLRGVLRLPGDKSISHRYAMLGAFASGVTRLSNFSSGQDCASTLHCMETLGAMVRRQDDGSLLIDGCDGAFVEPSQPLDCGNSGSTMRLLSGLLAGQRGRFVLTGDESLSRRPMQRVARPLGEMGASIGLVDGHAPMTVEGRPLKSIQYATPVPSAQVKSAVLFAGLQAEGVTTVEESVRTRDHSELALRAFGAELDRSRTSASIRGGQKLSGIEAIVPGDMSSAAFFLCAAAICAESSITIEGLGMNPTRAALLDVLTGLGLGLSVLSLEESNHELFGTVHASAPQDGLRGATISGALTAQLIDELPVLAAIAPYTRDGISIRDAGELRVKESDRIALVARNLRAMGAEVTEHEDGMTISGRQEMHGAEVDSGGDHRIAMAFAVAGLRAASEVKIDNADCVAVSFPEFFELLDRLSES